MSSAAGMAGSQQSLPQFPRKFPEAGNDLSFSFDLMFHISCGNTPILT
jgi:hypothetical protein